MLDPNRDPLSGAPPASVPLARAPLIRVIAQVRFPLIASIEKREFIAAFQEAIRPAYPVLRTERTRGIVMGAEGMIEARANPIWRFRDATGAWRVTLAPELLAIETDHYTHRDDFLARFEQVLIALRDHIGPSVIDRLGIRYIDRIQGADIAAIPELMHPAIAGVMATALAPHASHSLVENLFALPDEPGRLLTRWGLVPPRATVDPAAIAAIDEPSWLLDLDAFCHYRDEPRSFEVAAVIAQARAYAERIYCFFRWAVTDKFLRRYGAQ